MQTNEEEYSVSSVSQQTKLLSQSLCDSGIEWDAPITEKLKSKWLKLVDDLQETIKTNDTA